MSTFERNLIWCLWLLVVLCLLRFDWLVTIFVSVNFPVKNLELKDYIPLPTPPKEEEEKKLRSKYDLIANIVHEGKPGEGSYKVSVQRKSEELW